jgi:hypothetical protein
MPNFTPQKIPSKNKGLHPEEILCTLCYLYPQYTYAQARKLPYKRISKLIEVARREQAKFKYDLVQIVAAPTTKKHIGVKKLSEHYKSLLD